jgi:superfamily II DNA or RNA helicase
MEALQDQFERYENPELDQVQDECLSAIEQARMNGLVKVHVNMATGTGKTEVSAKDVRRYLEDWWPDGNILYLCHDTRILDQAAETYERILPSYVTQGYIYGNEVDKDEQLTFASFQKLNTQDEDGKLYQTIDPRHYKYIVIDEGHHAPAETYQPIIDYFEPDFMLSKTATPDRTDQQPIEEVVGPEVYRLTLEEAIAKGHLASVDYRVFTEGISIPSDEELQDKKVSLAEITSKIFVERQDEQLVRMIEEELADHPDPRAVVFCPNIDSAEHFSSLLPGNVATLHSQLGPEEQDDRLEAFKNGVLDTIVVVDQLNEGADIPEAY